MLIYFDLFLNFQVGTLHSLYHSTKNKQFLFNLFTWFSYIQKNNASIYNIDLRLCQHFLYVSFYSQYIHIYNFRNNVVR